MEYAANLDLKLNTDIHSLKEEFMERIKLYFEANEINNEKEKKAILLTKVDADTYSVIKKSALTAQTWRRRQWKKFNEKWKNTSNLKSTKTC